MTRRELRSEAVDLKALLTGDGDYLRTMVEAIVQATSKSDTSRTRIVAEPLNPNSETPPIC